MPRRCPDRRNALILGALAFCVYAATMSRSIYTGDDGDFLVAMLTFGNCHPTGYPTFLLAGRALAAALSPFHAEPALCINLLTALFGAGAVAVFYRLVQTALSDRAIAALAALTLAFSPTLWQQCLSCEVYSLTALLLASTLWCAVLWSRDPADPGKLHTLALLYGLSLTNNLTMALFLPGFLAFVLWTRPGLLRDGRRILALAVRFVAPLGLYAYLPLAATFGHSPNNWGDPSDWQNFVNHVSGLQYRGLMFREPLALWPQRLAGYGRLLLAEYAWPLLVLAALGLWTMGRRQPKALLLTVWIFAADIVYATNYRVMDIYVYFIPSYLCIALWIAYGVHAAVQPLLARLDERQRPLAALVAVCLPLLSIAQHGAAIDKSRNFLERDYSLNLLRSCPPDAIVVTSGSITFTLEYQQFIRGVRPDLLVLPPDMLLGTMGDGRSWFYQRVKRRWPEISNTYPVKRVSAEKLRSGQFLVDVLNHALATGKPVVFVADAASDHQRHGFVPPKIEMLKSFVRAPWGLVERLYVPGAEPDAAALLAENERLWPQIKTDSLFVPGALNDTQQRHIPARYFFGLKALEALATRAGHTETARDARETAARIFPDAAAR